MDRRAVQQKIAPVDANVTKPKRKRQRGVERPPFRVPQLHRASIAVLRRVDVPLLRVGKVCGKCDAPFRIGPHASAESTEDGLKRPDFRHIRRVVHVHFKFDFARDALTVGNKRRLAALDVALHRRVGDTRTPRHHVEIYVACHAAVLNFALPLGCPVRRVEIERQGIERIRRHVEDDRLPLAGFRELRDVRLATRERHFRRALAVDIDDGVGLKHREREDYALPRRLLRHREVATIPRAVADSRLDAFVFKPRREIDHLPVAPPFVTAVPYGRYLAPAPVVLRNRHYALPVANKRRPPAPKPVERPARASRRLLAPCVVKPPRIALHAIRQRRVAWSFYMATLQRDCERRELGLACLAVVAYRDVETCRTSRHRVVALAVYPVVSSLETEDVRPAADLLSVRVVEAHRDACVHPVVLPDDNIRRLDARLDG